MIPQILANYFIRYYSKYNMRDSYRFINPFAKNNSKTFNITNNHRAREIILFLSSSIKIMNLGGLHSQTLKGVLKVCGYT